MRELTTKELDTVIGGGISSPGVYLQEISANLISIPGVTTTAQQTFVYQKNSCCQPKRCGDYGTNPSVWHCLKGAKSGGRHHRGRNSEITKHTAPRPYRRSWP